MQFLHSFSAVLPNGVIFYGSESTYKTILALWKN